MNCQIIILAAGNGTRMKSELPKVMHKICGRTMLDLVVSNAKMLSDDIILVYSPKMREYFTEYSDICKLVPQEETLGTAHAVYCGLDFIDRKKTNLVLYADNPLISKGIMEQLLQELQFSRAALATLVFYREDPSAYGRIILDEQQNFLKIVEFKQANDIEKAIKLCNSGIMAFAPGILNKYVKDCLIPKGETESYLTKIVEICKNAGEKVTYLISDDSNIVLGVNTQEELIAASAILSKIT